MTVIPSLHQRSLATCVFRIDGAIAAAEESDGSQMAVSCRPVKRRVATVVTEVNVSPISDQQLHHFHIAPFSSLDKRGRRWVLLVSVGIVLVKAGTTRNQKC